MENYKDRELVSSSNYDYYDNGQLSYSENYKDGELHGLSESYYENGQLEWSSNYKDVLHGLSESYYENGQLQFSENFKNGRHGLFKWYLKNGSARFHKILKMENFTKSILILLIPMSINFITKMVN